MKIIEKFPHDVTEHADMGITMSDGCRLSARAWIPNDAHKEPMPVILEHLPYRKRDGTISRDQFTHRWFAGHGYVCVRTDIRGNGESEGLMHDEYSPQELEDAVEIIAWLAQQPWCNGNVGMIGISWGGFNALQVASMQPDALKAIVTVCSSVDRYADDIHYKGGCLLGENFGWASNMLAYSSRPPDPALVGDKWQSMWQHRLDNIQFDLSTWLRHQHRDDYWKHGSVCEDYSRIKAAVLAVGGWHDGYRNTVSHLVENVSAPVKGIVGPWIHKYPHYSAPKPAIGFLQECKRWWDQYLKGIDTGVTDDPDYRAYVMDSIAPKRWVDERPGRWIGENNWPSDKINFIDYFLVDKNTLRTEQGDTQVTIDSPMDCGGASGEYFPFTFGDELPDEQTYDDNRSVCFTSEPLTTDLDIVGAPKISLKLTADQTNAQLTVRLLDIRPNGSSAIITYGVLNLTHAESHENPTALIPGQIFDCSITLDQIAYRIPATHQLRVALSNTYWPVLWPSPNRTTLKLSSGRISIPVHASSSNQNPVDEVNFEAPEGAAHWQPNVLRPASYQRTLTEDSATSTVITEMISDFGENEDPDHGLISGGRMIERWSIQPDDPLSARGTNEWEHTGGRAGSRWRTEVESSIYSDEENFYFEAVLKAYLNDKEFFSRTIKDQVERDLV